MKFLIVLSAVCSLALAAPLDDTEEVKAAKEAFQAAFDAAEKGEHAKLAPQPVANAYLADSPDVAWAKANFAAQYNTIEATQNYAAWPYTSVWPYASAPIITAAAAPAPVATVNTVNTVVSAPIWSGYYGLPSWTPYVPLTTYVAAAPEVAVAEAAPAAAAEAPAEESADDDNGDDGDDDDDTTTAASA